MLRTRLIAGPRAGFVLSAIVATLLTIVSVGETFFEPLRVRPGEAGAHHAAPAARRDAHRRRQRRAPPGARRAA